MQLPSPEIIATWPAPNYVDPETRGNTVLVVNVVLFPVTLFIILIRLYTRLRISKSFGLDDWLILVAMLPSTTFAILAILAEEVFEFNRHVWDLPYSQVTFGLQFVMITQIIFTLGQTLTKCSMLALLYRILSDGKRFKIITIAATVIITVQGTIFILVTIFQCRPPSHYWLVTFSSQPECINETVHVIFAGSLNTLSDLFVALFPIPQILKLQIPRRQRLIVIFLFAAGLLVCVAGAVRTYYTYVELTSTDETWDNYYVWISSSVELYIGIIGASIPATKPFFKRYIPFFIDPTLISNHNNDYTISSADKGPFSESNTIATFRNSRTFSQADLEMGDIREREMKTKRRSRDLDAIEEIGGSDTSISSFINIGSESERGGKMDESKGDDMEIEIGMRDGEMSLRSDDTFDYIRTSKDELMNKVDVGLAVPYRPRHPRFSR